ncbi:MAG: von Willebrand factor type A domain-containing protein, partial [Verrucomicrobia bacterium]|nr:von Willebrand factor type A domain-containing protein [Verrucomicrobiota bacterium]
MGAVVLPTASSMFVVSNGVLVAKDGAGGGNGYDSFSIGNYKNPFTFGGGGTTLKTENFSMDPTRSTGYFVRAPDVQVTVVSGREATVIAQANPGSGTTTTPGWSRYYASSFEAERPTVTPPLPLPPSVINSVDARNLAAKAMAPRPSMQVAQLRQTLTRAGAIQSYGSRRATTSSPALQLRYPSFNTETYARIRDNPFLAVAEQPLSTFSIDVDTASYANVRRFLMQGSLPPRDAVRIEEMVNYFTYDYAKPKGGDPFSVNIEAAGCPWNAGHRLVRIGLKGREVPAAKRPPCSLVFLIDVSGSMADANKLSLIKPALRMLVEQLTENERVGIVVYNDTARVLLHSTSGDRKQEIIDAIESLQANGSTNGGDGIRQAYDMATRHFVERGVNRVILCTDGDFNVGTTELAELTRLIEQKRQSGVFLSVLGFGAGNLKDATLERLADKGNG